MNNLLPSQYLCHERYDLKGSTFGRYTNTIKRTDAHVTLKDLDLYTTYRVSTVDLRELHCQLQRDCNLLSTLNIMDYSLLLGVHYKSLAAAEADALTTLRLESNSHNPALLQRMTFSQLARKQKGMAAMTESGEAVLLFVGIIDILQQFGMTKKCEHLAKGVRYFEHKNEISVVPPTQYALRFKDFIAKVFVPVSWNQQTNQGV